MTPAGIEPATFRFVAQHLNHCATAVPNKSGVTTEIRCVTKTEVYNDVFEVTVARNKAEIMSHGNDIIHMSAASELCIRSCSTRKRRGNVSANVRRE